MNNSRLRIGLAIIVAGAGAYAHAAIRTTTASVTTGVQRIDDDAAMYERARRLLSETPLIDGHNDVPWQYRRRVNNHLHEMDFASDLSDTGMQTDLPRLREGGVGGQFWSVYIPATMRGQRDGDARVVLEQIDVVHRLIAMYPDDLELALTADDVERIHRQGRIASMMGMEGGHSIENSLAVLRATYALGARYMTLTHSRTIDWADSATDVPLHGGLTEFGKEVVREMNRLGMLVDLSHVAPSTMHDALDVSRAPVIFSHSSARAICDHVRNVPDDLLERLPDNGGVVMVCFLASYVSEELRLWQEQMQAHRSELMSELRGERHAVQDALAEWIEVNPRPDASVSQVADHIDHVRGIAGIGAIGIGGDYDGTTSLPIGLEDVSTYPNLLVELMKRGYSDDDIRKIIGLNVLRVMRDVEKTASALQAVEPPSSAQIAEVDGDREPDAEDDM